MSALRLTLEEFHVALPEAEPPPAPPSAVLNVVAAPEEDALDRARLRSEAYAEGYEEGAAAALAAQDAELKLVLAEISEAIADAGLGAAEARATVYGLLRPLIEELTDRVFPALAARGLVAEILESVRAAVDAAPDPVVEVRVAPEMRDRVRAALAEAGTTATVTADPDLPGLSAEVRWAGGGDEIDIAESLR
ncbi:MAG: hypothetical protein AAFW69_06820, partial [Pseudomonadota bacterium]